RPHRLRGAARAPPRSAGGAESALPRRPPWRRPAGGGADGPVPRPGARRRRAGVPLPALLDRGGPRPGRPAPDTGPDGSAGRAGRGAGRPRAARRVPPAAGRHVLHEQPLAAAQPHGVRGLLRAGKASTPGPALAVTAGGRAMMTLCLAVVAG